MSQLVLTFPRRFELPGFRVSWRVGETAHVVTVGPSCHDESWPWWRPWQPWTQAVPGAGR